VTGQSLFKAGTENELIQTRLLNQFFESSQFSKYYLLRKVLNYIFLN